MRLENRKEKVIPLRQFIIRVGYYFLISFVLIVFSLSVGLVGYHYIADLEWVDSFHMSSMILTGMGPVSEMKTPMAKLFSSFYALYSGVAFLSISTSILAPIIHRILHILHADDDE